MTIRLSFSLNLRLWKEKKGPKHPMSEMSCVADAPPLLQYPLHRLLCSSSLEATEQVLGRKVESRRLSGDTNRLHVLSPLMTLIGLFLLSLPPPCPITLS